MSSLFEYDVDVKPMIMDIRSDTLEPISTNASLNRFVFRLDSAGYLDQNSMLLFKPQTAAFVANDNIQRVHQVYGGLGAIKRATIQVGDYILNDTLDIGKISCLMNLAPQQKSKLNAYSSQYYKNSFRTAIQDNGYDAATSTVGGNGTLKCDDAKNGVNYGAMNNNNAGASVQSCRITRTAANNHQIGIPLGAILPCLQGRTIPLFLFQEYRILITVEFDNGNDYIHNTLQNRGVNPNNAIGVGGLNNAFLGNVGCVNYRDVKLQVDYIIYPSEIQMEAKNMTNKQGGLRLDFYDIIKVEKSIPAATARIEQAVEHRIGADNKEVHKIYMMKNFNDTAEDDRVYLRLGCQGIEEEEYNVNIDGIDVFQEDKFNPCSQYNETTNCLGSEIQVERPLYFADINTWNNRLVDWKNGLLGKMKPLCLDLTNGEPQIVGGGRQIGAYPIIWKYKRTADVAVAALGNDVPGNNLGNIKGDSTRGMSVDYFILVSRIAQIQSSNAGTSVMVSY